MENFFKSEFTLYSNRFEVTVNIDCLTTIKNLNIGNIVKRVVTRYIQTLTKVSVNVSYFKKNQDIINKKLEESNLKIEEYTATKNKKLFLTIQYLGLQEKRDRKIKEIVS
jgi:hypothetical protein